MSMILIIILSVLGGAFLMLLGLCAFAACLEQEAAEFERMSGRSLQGEMTSRRVPFTH